MNSRRRKLGFAILCGVLLLLPPSFFYLVEKQQQGLDLEITLDGETFVPDEPIVMTLKVENVSSRHVAVAGWPAIRADECHVLISQTLELELHDERLGQPQVLRDPFGLRLAARPTNLPPGGAMTFRCDIVRIFGITRPGNYVLKGIYFGNGWPTRVARRWFRHTFEDSWVQDTAPFEIRLR